MTAMFDTDKDTGSVRNLSGSRWQKIQSLFAKVIGINITLLDAEGNCLSQSPSVTPDINDIAVPLGGVPLINPPEFITNAVRSGQLSGKNQLSRYGLHYFLIEISISQGRKGFFAIGPVLVGKTEPREKIAVMCAEEKIHEEIYADQIEELKRYSYVGISAILEFLSEITEWSMELLESEGAKADGPGYFLQSRGIESLLSLRYGHDLSNSLLDIALGLVEGTSGSVLLYDSLRDCFEIQAARGLNGEIVRDAVIPAQDSVSGLVAKRGKPMLLHKEISDEAIRQRLQKPSIISSIVIPMHHREKLVGLFCVNAQDENPNFNQENLLLLNQLGKIASIALARINES